VIKFAGIKAD